MKVSNNSLKFPYIEINTVHKSGTYFILKIFKQLGINEGNSKLPLHLSQKLNLKPGVAPSWHPESKYNPKKRYCILYRDPRDVVVSSIFFHQKINYCDAQKYDVDYLLDLFLNSEKLPWKEDLLGFQAKVFLKDLEMALHLKNHPKPNRLLVRFEDIIPSYAGGSSDEERFQVLRKISNFSKRPISDEKIREVMKSCWGGTLTFREDERSKVGQWVRHFKPRHIELFQKKYNHLVLGLGYETDPNWHLKYLNSMTAC